MSSKKNEQDAVEMLKGVLKLLSWQRELVESALARLTKSKSAQRSKRSGKSSRGGR